MKRLALAVVLVAGLVPPPALGAATVLKSRLTGAQIVNDDGGAPRGVAQATFSLNEARGRLCFEIAYSGLGGKVTGGYLRKGGPGQLARPAVTLFSEAAASPVSGCVAEVPMKMLSALRRHPAGHYVDLATRRFPKGAVRGQLHSGAGTGATLEGPSSGGVSR